MIERELIFLLGYTALMSFFAWLTFKVVAYIRVNDTDFGAGAIGTLLVAFWACYFFGALFNKGGYLPTTLWFDWLESRGILYSSGIFNK